MSTKKTAPVNLNLFTIHFPIPAIVSILHRLSGVLLFLLIPLMLWGFSLSLSSADEFDALVSLFSPPWVKFLLWVGLSAFLYHAVAGVRHLLMDLGIGESLAGGRVSAMLVLAISILLAVLTGIWLW